MSRDLKRQLKNLKHGEANPRQEWLKNSRALLLSQIKNTVSTTAESRGPKALDNVWSGLSVFLPQRLVYNFIRPVAVLLIVAMVGMSGWIATVDAAYETLPGDLLYPAKRAAEKTQVAMAVFAGNKTAETKLHMEFAKRRAVETKKIVGGADQQKKALVSETVSELKNELKGVNNNLEDIKNKPDGQLKSAAFARDVRQNTEQIKNVLQQVKENLQVSTVVGDNNLSKEVAAAKDLVKDTGVKAVEVMVAKHLEGDRSVTKEEVASAISNTLQTAAADAGESKQNVAGAKTMVEAVKTEVKDIAIELKKQGNDGVTSSTRELSEKISTVSNQTVAAVLKTEAASADVDKKINEAKTLLENNDLAKAVDKIRELNEATKAVEKISDNTLEKAQTVLPIVQTIKEAGEAFSSSSTKDITLTVTTTPTAPAFVLTVSSTNSTVKIVTNTINLINSDIKK